jgi:hypothetical protein
MTQSDRKTVYNANPDEPMAGHEMWNAVEDKWEVVTVRYFMQLERFLLDHVGKRYPATAIKAIQSP